MMVRNIMIVIVLMLSWKNEKYGYKKLYVFVMTVGHHNHNNKRKNSLHNCKDWQNKAIRVHNDSRSLV